MTKRGSEIRIQRPLKPLNKLKKIVNLENGEFLAHQFLRIADFSTELFYFLDRFEI